jgi:hypothetical protein
MQHFAKLFRSVLLCVFSVFLFHDGFSQVNLTTNTYSQDFNSLPTTGSSNTWTNNSTLVGWYAERGAGTTTGTTVTAIIAGAGTSTTGALYSLGTGTTTDRTLGSTCSNAFGNVCYGLRILNQTGGSISSFTISYTGEQWRRENNATVQKIQFAYKTGSSLTALDATSITAGGFTAVTTLDFSSPIVGATSGVSLDGNATANRTTISNVVISLPSPLANGQEILLKWLDVNDSGNDHIMGIDDFTIVATPTAPTLTATPASITNLNYTTGNGPSTAGSYTLSGSVLTGSPDFITVTAPNNFEVSRISATMAFGDTVKIAYSSATLASTPIYVRLKAGLADGNYSGDVTHSGGGVTSPPMIALSGAVTNVPPPIVTTTGTLSTFNTVAGTPSASQSYTVSGTNLVSDITITAPTDFEIKTGAGVYANTIVLTPTSGSVSTTTIDVRLKGTASGTFTGNITNVSTTASANVAVNGVVGVECGISTDIATIRAAIPATNSSTITVGAIVSGTVTAIFGANKFYLQDATGGIAVFTTGIVSTLGLNLGDQVKITGTSGRRNGESQISTLTCNTKISSGTVPPPVIFDANMPAGTDLVTFLATNEGKLGKIISTNIPSTGTFSAGTSGLNYSTIACNNQGGTEIRVDPGSGTLIGSNIPTVTQDVTGIVGRFITADGGTDKYQIFPRSASDLVNSATPCTVTGGCGITTFTDSPTQLDIMNWNIEWLGHPSNGPTNKALQQTNAQTVLNGAGADVYMLQEICQYNSANPADNTTSFGKLVEGLNTTFGANTYTGECSAAVSGSVADANPQRVCIIYKNSVVTKVFSRPMFNGFTPATYPPTGTPSQFWASGRKPFMFMAKVNINSQVDTILLVGLHAKAGSTLEDYNRRKFDVRAMYDTLQAQYPTRKTIVIGDLNDDVDKSIASNTANGQLVSSYAPFLYVNPDETAIGGTRPNASWNPISKTLSDVFCASTASFSDYIDHQIISNEMSGSSTGYRYVLGSVSSFRPVIANYATTTSDHYATTSRFEYIAPPSIVSIVPTGNWSSPTTWSCNCVPTSADNVVIETGHTITVDAASQAKTLNLKGTLNYVSAFTLSLGM